MKPSFITVPVLATLLFTSILLSCRKQNEADSLSNKLRNSTWLVTKEIWFFPDGKLEISTRNSVWTFSRHQNKIFIFNPGSFISHEKGTWNTSPEHKLAINIKNDDFWQYTRSFKLITETASYIRLEAEEYFVETSDYGITSKVHYELMKL